MRESFHLLHSNADHSETNSIGFHSSRAAADSSVENLRLQPAYRNAPDGFAIEVWPLDKTVRFKNNTEKPLDLMVEPWGSTDVIPPRSVAAIHYPAPAHREDTSFAELSEDAIRFWCEGATYQVEVDGVMLET